MELKHLLLSIGLVMTSLVIQGQTTITGKVTDDQGEPLIGVNILILQRQASSPTGTITDVDGAFSLSVPTLQDTLICSYVGREETIVPINGRPHVEIVMQAENALLNEVVVVGYGVQKKRVSTGAIAKIEADRIEAVKTQNVQSILEGQVSGLIINESSGQPGSTKSILIRGISTNGDNSPLFIVDGLQVNDINNINPNDIESVDVLKDAASCAIYGARAANGVVIITTKKGQEGQARLTYDGYWAQSNPWRTPTMLSSQDYLTLTREKYANAGQLNSLEALGFPQSGTSTSSTDWMDVLFDPAPFYSHRLSASGKDLFFSLEYSDQQGVIAKDKSRYKRYGARLNGTKEINDYFSIGENLYVNRTESRSLGINDAFGTTIADALAYDPLTPVYDEEAQYGFAQSKWVQKEYINPLSRIFLSNASGHADQVLGNVYLNFSPIKHLSFRSDMGIDYYWYNYRSFVPDYAFHTAFNNVTNDVAQGYGFGQSYQFENYLNYDNSIGRHHFNIVLGTSYRNSYSEFAGASSSSIPDAVKFDNNWQFVDAGVDSADLANGGASVKYRLISYYGRLIYDFNDRYLLTATLRRDGSSNFGRNNRWGLFPSLSLGWILSDENFFNSGAIDFLKIRTSWGINGNDRISPLSYASTIENVFTYSFGQPTSLFRGAALATPPNPNIKWEESQQFDIGIDVRMFDDRLSAEFDYFIKSTKDLLMEEIIPGYIGATNNPISNLGEIRNNGIEAALQYRTHIGQVQLSAGINYTTFKNEVIDVAGDAGFIQGYTWPVRNTTISRMTEGFPVGHFVGYKTNGIFQSQEEVFSHINQNGDLLQPNAAPGDLIFIDVNGDGTINSDDITDIGSPWPDHVIGFNLQADYKGFDLGILLSAQLGHDIFRAYERSDISFTNYQEEWLDRWTPENPGAKYPRLVINDPNNNQRPSDFYVEDGSFLRLRNVQFGYSLPDHIADKLKLSGLRIYVSGMNLLTITNYSGLDPDIGSNGWILDTGIDKGFYPSNRTFGGGITITL